MTIQTLICKLIEKKGKKSEIEIEGQKIEVPSEYLPDSIKVGEEMRLCFLSEKDARMKEENMAKTILEEILNGK
ncbi:MAG: hypothetical protein WCP93_01555 [Candidatus Berkelbacteria bacterium]